MHDPCNCDHPTTPTYLRLGVGREYVSIFYFVLTVACDPQIVNKIGLLSDGAASGSLCGKNCVELVHHIPVECAEAFGHFLTSLIGTKLKGVQRGVVYSALREMQVPSQAERALQSVTEALPSLCSANINRDIKPVGLIKGWFAFTFCIYVVGRKAGTFYILCI